jgi:hypothetical protein
VFGYEPSTARISKTAMPEPSRRVPLQPLAQPRLGRVQPALPPPTQRQPKLHVHLTHGIALIHRQPPRPLLQRVSEYVVTATVM